jgi:hypothetical protein
MFVMVAQISMSITATRIYISLADFSSSADMYDLHSFSFFIVLNEVGVCSVVDLVLERGRRAISNATSLSNPMLVTVVQVHVAHEQYPIPPSAALSPTSNNRGKLPDKLQRLGAEPSRESGEQHGKMNVVGKTTSIESEVSVDDGCQRV